MTITITKYRVRTIYNTYYWSNDISDKKMLDEFFYNLVVERCYYDRIIDITEMKSREVSR